MTLLDFLPAGWGKHKGGGEWAGPCPRCGGADRFIAWPEHHSGATGGKYLCRGCAPEGGDCIQFLRDFQGMTYPEACEALQVEPRQNSAAHAAHRSAGEQPWEPKTERLPSEPWQRRAVAFLAECREALDSDAGRNALQGRALSMEFALRHGLGWNPADRYEVPETWGLEPWMNDKANPGKVSLPAGLVVPTFRKAGPVAVKIRRRDWQEGDPRPKYQVVKGGGNGALILGKPGLPVVLVESELDALLIAQEASDLCSVMALGSASNHPHLAAAEFLKASPLILAALDFDAPDSKGRRAGASAWLWWREHFPQSRRWPAAAGKDPGEMHQAGVSVRIWVEAGLAEKTRKNAPESPEPARREPSHASPAAIAHARSLLVSCPGRKTPLHCWHCSRCSGADTCLSWRTRRADVEFFRRHEKPYSLYLVEEFPTEVFQ